MYRNAHSSHVIKSEADDDDEQFPARAFSLGRLVTGSRALTALPEPWGVLDHRHFPGELGLEDWMRGVTRASIQTTVKLDGSD